MGKIAISGPTNVKVHYSPYLGADMSGGGSSSPTTEAIYAGVPEGAEKR